MTVSAMKGQQKMNKREKGDPKTHRATAEQSWVDVLRTITPSLRIILK